MEYNNKILFNNMLDIMIEYLVSTENYVGHTKYSIQEEVISIMNFCSQKETSISAKLLENILRINIPCKIDDNGNILYDTNRCSINDIYNLTIEFKDLLQNYIGRETEDSKISTMYREILMIYYKATA